jgi:hypothetical protein
VLGLPSLHRLRLWWRIPVKSVSSVNLWATFKEDRAVMVRFGYDRDYDA